MNDSAILHWIATHLRGFRVTLRGAVLEYLDSNGCHATITVDAKDGAQMTDEELLRECVQQAMAANHLSHD